MCVLFGVKLKHGHRIKYDLCHTVFMIETHLIITFGAMSQEFGKEEKLKSEKAIGRLFEEGQSLTQFPLRLYFLAHEFENGGSSKVAVSVSKRNFNKAVDRNRIKRLLREAYRLNKSQLFNNTNDQYALMILYIGKDVPEFNLINVELKLLFGKFSAIVAEEKK